MASNMVTLVNFAEENSVSLKIQQEETCLMENILCVEK